MVLNDGNVFKRVTGSFERSSNFYFRSKLLGISDLKLRLERGKKANRIKTRNVLHLRMEKSIFNPAARFGLLQVVLFIQTAGNMKIFARGRATRGEEGERSVASRTKPYPWPLG